MRLQPLFCELVCALMWLPEHPLVKIYTHLLTTSNCVPYPLKCFSESTLPQPRKVILGCPEEIRIRKVERWLAVLKIALVGESGIAVLARKRPKIASLREQKIKNDLRVKGPIARIAEHEDRVHFDLLRVFLSLRMVVSGRQSETLKRTSVGFVIRSRSKGRKRWESGDEVAWSNDIGESVST